MNYLIALDVALMNANSINIADWKVKNKDMIDNSSTNTKIFVNVESLYKSLKNDDWLDKNGQYVDINLSKVTIESLHSVDVNTTQKAINDVIKNGGVKDSIKYSDLIDPKYGFKFDDDKYRSTNGNIDNYHILEFDTNGKLKKVSFGMYDNTKYCFSSPFLYCLKKLNTKINVNTVFNFVLFNDILKKENLGIRIDLGTSYKYYDFSQIPPGSLYDIGVPDSYGSKIGNTFHLNSEKLFSFNGKEIILSILEDKFVIKKK